MQVSPGVLILLLAMHEVAVAQNGQAQRCAQREAGGAGIFVMADGVDQPLSASDYAPTHLTTARRSIGLRVCVRIDPQPPRAGAINIKMQVYSAAAGRAANPGREVDYENDTPQFQAGLTALRARRGADAYPNIDIADYQDYHGCTRRRPHAIARDFHVRVGDRATNDDPWRQKFVFRGDVRPSCAVPDVLAEFITALPSIGRPTAIALPRYDPRVERIVRRRSAIMRYDVRPGQAGFYLTYDLGTLEKERCARIEASHVFDDSTTSTTVGVGCHLPD